MQTCSSARAVGAWSERTNIDRSYCGHSVSWSHLAYRKGRDQVRVYNRLAACAWLHGAERLAALTARKKLLGAAYLSACRYHSVGRNHGSDRATRGHQG